MRVIGGDTVLASGLLAAADPPLEVAASIARTPAMASFVALGLEHVLMGWDHLLFLAALLLFHMLCATPCAQSPHSPWPTH